MCLFLLASAGCGGWRVLTPVVNSFEELPRQVLPLIKPLVILQKLLLGHFLVRFDRRVVSVCVQHDDADERERGGRVTF